MSRYAAMQMGLGTEGSDVDIRDYILGDGDLDWAELLAHWEDLLPDELTVWFVNRFGEPLLVFDDESVHRLDLDTGKVQRLAESRDAFSRAADKDANSERWFRISEVDRAVAAGLVLESGQCYGYALPPILGGEYTTDNMRVLSPDDNYAFLTDLHRQIRDLPDGTQVRLRFR